MPLHNHEDDVSGLLRFWEVHKNSSKQNLSQCRIRDTCFNFHSCDVLASLRDFFNNNFLSPAKILKDFIVHEKDDQEVEEKTKTEMMILRDCA